MLEFSIPDSPGTYKLNELLLKLLQTNKEMFYNDFKITSAYGTLAGCTWNGGRELFGIIPEYVCKEVINMYNSNNISYRYTFTNCFINKYDLYDRYCNMLLRINKKLNGVTYNKNIIKDYVTKNYKNYYFVSSCTKNIKDIQTINRISKKELLVLDFKLNNTSIINNLKYPNNIEIITNEQCLPTCPFRNSHYKNIAKINMYLTYKQFNKNNECKNKISDYKSFMCKLPQYVSREKIYSLYRPLGINKFKLVGRHQSEPDLALLGYLDYFIKPEYHEQFINICKLNNII